MLGCHWEKLSLPVVEIQIQRNCVAFVKFSYHLSETFQFWQKFFVCLALITLHFYSYAIWNIFFHIIYLLNFVLFIKYLTEDERKNVVLYLVNVVQQHTSPNEQGRTDNFLGVKKFKEKTAVWKLSASLTIFCDR